MFWDSDRLRRLQPEPSIGRALITLDEAAQ